jgi:3-oxoacyl-[acyl-carrier protein] reductase
MQDELRGRADAPIAERTPLGRYVDPHGIAEAVAFLASGRAGFITGEIVDVNGGLIMDWARRQPWPSHCTVSA